MNITVERRFRGSQKLATRLEEIAEPAGKLVADRLGDRMPHVEFVFTNASGMASGMRRADSAHFGPPRGFNRLATAFMTHWTARHSLGSTTVGVRTFLLNRVRANVPSCQATSFSRSIVLRRFLSR